MESVKADKVYAGTIDCEVCEASRDKRVHVNKARYSQKIGNANSRRYICGVHTLKNKPFKALPNLTRQQQDAIYSSHRMTLKQDGVRGNISVGRLYMLRNPPLIDGILYIFPNRKSISRRDGVGMPQLSPMCLGPCVNIPLCGENGVLNTPLNIENYHQLRKIYPQELDHPPSGGSVPRTVDTTKSDRLTADLPSVEKLKKMLNEWFSEPRPMRHKFKGQSSVVCSIHLDENEKLHTYTYVQARYFYCKQYEWLAPNTEDWEKLLNIIDAGTDVRIMGYDGREFSEEMGESEDLSSQNLLDRLYKLYKDPSFIFGHEFVLYSLLMKMYGKICEYPWDRYKRTHPNLWYY